MKKTVLALFAVLLVLSLAGCESGDDSNDPNLSKVPDGMVKLTINVESPSRALNLANAGTASNYYEVIFKYGTKYYEVQWTGATSPSIIIPTGNYAATGNDAVLFAGTAVGGNNVLLGVGTLNTTAIASTTTSVTFTVTSLKTGGGTGFAITGPSEDGSGHDYTGPSTTLTYGGVPVYAIPPAGYVAGTPPAAQAIGGKWSLSAVPSNDKVIVSGAWTITSVTTITPGTTTAFGGAALTYTPGANPASGTALGATEDFEFTIAVPGTGSDGVTGFYINVPVRAFGAITYEPFASDGVTVTSTGTSATPVVWNIRGGTDITAADNGTGTGAVIILGVGLADWEATLTIPAPTTPYS